MRLGFQRLTENRNLWLLAVFGVYMGAILVFASAYYVLYKAQRGNFAFNSDVLRSQKASVEAATQQQLARTAEHLSLLEELQAVLNSAALQKGLFKSGSRSIPIVWVEDQGAKYTFFGHETIATFNGSATVRSKLRVERADFPPIEILDGPISPLPKNPEDYKAVCETWRSQLTQRTEELKRIEASFATDAPDVWTFADFFYFSAITQATVGYGDIVPNTTPVRLLVTFQTILSVALVGWVINIAFEASGTAKSSGQSAS